MPKRLMLACLYFLLAVAGAAAQVVTDPGPSPRVEPKHRLPRDKALTAPAPGQISDADAKRLERAMQRNILQGIDDQLRRQGLPK